MFSFPRTTRFGLQPRRRVAESFRMTCILLSARADDTTASFHRGVTCGESRGRRKALPGAVCFTFMPKNLKRYYGH
jgi:hypothetical protein